MENYWQCWQLSEISILYNDENNSIDVAEIKNGANYEFVINTSAVI